VQVGKTLHRFVGSAAARARTLSQPGEIPGIQWKAEQRQKRKFQHAGRAKRMGSRHLCMAWGRAPNLGTGYLSHPLWLVHSCPARPHQTCVGAVPVFSAERLDIRFLGIGVPASPAPLSRPSCQLIRPHFHSPSSQLLRSCPATSRWLDRARPLRLGVLPKLLLRM